MYDKPSHIWGLNLDLGFRKSSIVSLDVLPAVVRWLTSPEANHGLLVDVVGLGTNKTTPARHIRIRRDAGDDAGRWSEQQPILLAYTDDGKSKQATGAELARKYENAQKRELAQKRPRRDMKPRRRQKDIHMPCKRHSMYVDFTEVSVSSFSWCKVKF